MLQSGHGRRDGRTDRRTDGRTDGVKPIYPQQLRCSGGIINIYKYLRSSTLHFSQMGVMVSTNRDNSIIRSIVWSPKQQRKHQSPALPALLKGNTHGRWAVEFLHKEPVMPLQLAQWCLKSPVSRLFTEWFIQGADQRKYHSSASLVFVGEIHRGPVNSPHKGPVTRKMLPFDDVIMAEAFPCHHHGNVAKRTYLGLKSLVCIQRDAIISVKPHAIEVASQNRWVLMMLSTFRKM